MGFIKGLSLDEAIKHCLEVVDNNKDKADKYDRWDEWESAEADNCLQCATDHQQLAEWLTELKELRNSLGAVKLKDMKEAVGLLQELNAENDQLTSQLLEAKRLLKLAADDIETAMTEEKCKVCGLDYCGNDTICKWRYADEALKLLGGSENGET